MNSNLTKAIVAYLIIADLARIPIPRMSGVGMKLLKYEVIAALLIVHS
jgi:hypothetical protein